MKLNKILDIFTEIKNIEGSGAVKLKSELFGQILVKTQGKILHLFNPELRVRLGLNESAVKKCIGVDVSLDSLDLDHLLDLHEQIAVLSGHNSTKNKLDLLKKIFSGIATQLRPIFAEYYSKSLFTIGFSRALIFQNLCDLDPNKKERLKELYETGVPFYEMYRYLKENLNVSLGTNIKPMLASTHDLKSTTYFMELKLDGVRLMFKKLGDTYSCWTRSGLYLDPETILASLVKTEAEKIRSIKEDFLLDGELWLPNKISGEGFRSIMPLIKLKHKAFKELGKAHYSCFDLIYYKGETLYDMPYEKRRDLLESLNVKLINRVKLNNVKILPKLLSRIKNSVYEGLILKEANGKYLPGKRDASWIKLKPIPDSIDALIVGAHLGTGKYKDLYSSFDIAVIDLETKTLVPVGQVGSGFTQDDLKELTERYNLNEKILIEVQSEAFVLGSLRFPRFIKLREDKDEPTSLEDLKKIYNP